MLTAPRRLRISSRGVAGGIPVDVEHELGDLRGGQQTVGVGFSVGVKISAAQLVLSGGQETDGHRLAHPRSTGGAGLHGPIWPLIKWR
jgi:hypothetical protein